VLCTVIRSHNERLMDSENVAHASPTHASLDRSDARRWQLLSNRLLAFLGAALLAAGLIFFFAYNWADLHRFGKFAVGFVAFLTAVAFALFSSRRNNLVARTRANEHAPRMEAVTAGQRSAFFAAVLCIGALLALIGQVYQTGADLWELFAIWAVLALPFALLSRSVETWLLWLGVANTALFLGLGEAWTFSSIGAALPRQLLCGIAFNAACLLLAERFARSPLFTPNRALPRTAALLALGGLCTGACAGVFNDDFAHFIPLLIAGTVLTLALYRHTRFDLVMLAMSGTTAIIFGTIALGKLVESGGGRHSWELIAMSCSVFLIVSSGLFIAWLLQLHREQRLTKLTAKPTSASAEAPHTQAQTLSRPPTDAFEGASSSPSMQPTISTPKKAATATPVPLWLSILQGIAAWIAAGLLASSLAAPFWLFEGGVWFIALAFIGGALALFYKVRDSVFFDQAALSLSFAGQGLLCVSVFEQWKGVSEKTGFTLSLVVALALFALRTTLLHRTLCLLWAATCLYLIVEPGYATHVLFGLGFSTATILLWLNRPDSRTGHRTRWSAPSLSETMLSLTHASSLIAWVFLGWNYFYHRAIFWKQPETPREIALLYSTASAALLVGLVAWLCRPLYANANAPERAKKQAALLLSAAGLFAALAYRDQALVLCAALLLATYAARQQGWFRAMLVALPILIWQLYYSFEQTLLMRSLTLAGSGALLLGLRQAIQSLTREPTRTHTANQTQPQPLPARHKKGSATLRWLIIAAAALVLALCLWGIRDNERVLAHGRPVLVELAPVDPRSLMQGDYMRLSYALESDLLVHMPQRREQTPRPSYAYLVLDEQSRATAVHSIGSQHTPLPEGATLAVKLRGKTDYSPSIASKEFFFQEGHGSIYEAAKWAELRVDASGKALLLNLRNEALEILGETKR